jgi:hypothetical protein
MESTKTIFCNIIKENKDSAHILAIIHDASFDLSSKKLQNLPSEEQAQKKLEKLFKIFITVLEEVGLNNSRTITSMIDGLIKAASYEKKQYLLKTFYEKEQLEASIYKQSLEIKHLIAKTYDAIEEASKNLKSNEKKEVLKSLSDAKLLSVEALGILKETVEQAFITTIEKARDIKDTTQEISKTFTYQAINEGGFTKQRILSIASTIIEAACDIADSDHANANDILNGAIEGTKDGISKAITRFKKEIRFAPEEIKRMQGQDIEESKRDIINMQEAFVEMLKQCLLKLDGISSKILAQIITEHDTYLAKLRRLGTEAAEVFSAQLGTFKDESLKEFREKAGKKIAKITKDTGQKVTAFTNDAAPKAKQMANEAKKLGSRAWEVAKSAVDDVLKKSKKH